jgi:hypothetical protein
LKSLAGSLVVLFFAGCILLPKENTNPAALVTPLTKLTSAVQSVVDYPENGIPVPDDKLLQASIRGKPELRSAFKEFRIKIWHDNKNVVILVCSHDGRIGLLEDASWTQFVDKKWYETEPTHPAVFSLVPVHTRASP